MTEAHPMPAEWGWYVSFDGEETYEGPYASKQVAIDDASSGDDDHDWRDAGSVQWIRFHVSECLPNHIRLSEHFDANLWVEFISDRMEDENAPDENGWHPLVDLTVEQVKSLQTHVRDAIDAWQKEHALPLRTWAFARSKKASVYKIRIDER